MYLFKHAKCLQIFWQLDHTAFNPMKTSKCSKKPHRVWCFWNKAVEISVLDVVFLKSISKQKSLCQSSRTNIPPLLGQWGIFKYLSICFQSLATTDPPGKILHLWETLKWVPAMFSVNLVDILAKICACVVIMHFKNVLFLSWADRL